MHYLTKGILAVLMAILLAACATAPKRVEIERSNIPEPATGEVAVFGKLRLVEFINDVPMPVRKLSGSLYLLVDGMDKEYQLTCSNAGDFGVYLPAGTYKVIKAKTNGYSFAPESLQLYVPSGVTASYAGTLSMDGTPSGVEPNSGDTVFVYSVKDEYRDFMSALRIAAPGSEGKFVKSLFKPGNALALGKYPTKVFRAEDVGKDLKARSDDLEEVVAGGLIAIPYVINPLWLLTKP